VRKRLTIATILIAVVLALALLLVMWTGQSSAPQVQVGMYLNDVLPDLRRTHDDVQIMPALFADAKDGRNLACCTKTDIFGSTYTLYLRFDDNDQITHARTVPQRAQWQEWIAKRFGW
jgi:hypothetical protein